MTWKMTSKRTSSAAETVQPDSEIDESPVIRVPCLTILCHPDMDRVGERALLPGLAGGGTVSLNRESPGFATPEGSPTEALDSPYVSARRSIILCDRGLLGIEIQPYAQALVTVAHEPLHGARVLSLSEIRGGVVIVLARRIALLLHLVALEQPILEGTLRPRARSPHFDMVGDSDALDEVRRKIANVADLELSVLIRGESGAGKEHVARAIWSASARAGRPFEALNMSTVPEGNMGLSALFGHVKGAFSGATNQFHGLFERNHGGTVFLDEVGACEPQVQDRLLRVLEDGVITPLGSQQERTVDVRVVSATDAALDAMIATGGFRAPLFHRLARYVIEVPPLAARRDDIARLVVHFVRRRLRASGASERLAPPRGQDKPWFPAELMALFVSHDWRGGNVRALANAVDRIWIDQRERAVLSVSEARKLLAPSGSPAPKPDSGTTNTRPTVATPAPRSLGRSEFIAVYRENGFSPAQTAAALGRPKGTIHSWLKRFGLRLAKQIDAHEITSVYEACERDAAATAAQLMVSVRSLTMRLRELGIAADEA